MGGIVLTPFEQDGVALFGKFKSLYKSVLPVHNVFI